MPLLLLLWMLKPEVTMGSYISLISLKKVVYVSWLSQFWFELQQLHHVLILFSLVCTISYRPSFSAWIYGPSVKHIGHKSMWNKNQCFITYNMVWESKVNPLTPMSDQDRISPYNINTISNRQVMQRKRNIN